MILPLRVFRKVTIGFRRLFYKILSDAKVKGSPICNSPVLATGKGKVELDTQVNIGLLNDTDFWTSYVFFNPRTKSSLIRIGKNSWVGNHFSAISEGPGIEIGEGVLIGTRVEIYDSDFHAVSPMHRMKSTPKTGKVLIGDDVWIGNNVTILKGTEIGSHSVVAAGAVVSGKFPSNVILGGVPAKIIRNIGD